MKTYEFNNKNIYKVCSDILNLVKNLKHLEKRQNVIRHIDYTIYDSNENFRFSGQASKNWKNMKDQVKEIKTGKINLETKDYQKNFYDN